MVQSTKITLYSARGTSIRWWNVDPNKPVVCNDAAIMQFTDDEGFEISVHPVGQCGNVLVVEKDAADAK